LRDIVGIHPVEQAFGGKWLRAVPGLADVRVNVDVAAAREFGSASRTPESAERDSQSGRQTTAAKLTTIAVRGFRPFHGNLPL